MKIIIIVLPAEAAGREIVIVIIMQNVFKHLNVYYFIHLYTYHIKSFIAGIIDNLQLVLFFLYLVLFSLSVY